ncbi:MAG: asparaginase, partial [Duncaniella sp.]|nr:asparaginase [Duncaniella sp.]
MKPRILIIYTGGTIGMIENPETKALEPFDFTHLIDNVPKIKKLEYHIDNIQFIPIDSCDMGPDGWKEIALAIEANYDNYDGFVVLHGTDTMAYTASALSFMLAHLDKPVIITGSQLPIGEVRTDGEENLITALQIAAATDFNGDPMVQEVAILFENYLWRGNRSTKMSADNFNAFKSNNYPPLAKIGLGIHFSEKALRRPNERRPLHVTTNMDPGVMTIALHPGITRDILHHQLNTPGIKGVVLR